MADTTQGEATNNEARAAAIAQARAASANARAYQCAMVYASFRAYVSLAVKGSGLLALFLSSVILLGGFIESLDKLGKKDFWCVTAITVIQAAGIFDDWQDSIERLAQFQEPLIFVDDKLESFLRTYTLTGILLNLLCQLLILPFLAPFICLQLISMNGPLVSAAISAWRIAKLNHGTDSMMAALDLFYSLVIFQGTMFLVLSLTICIGAPAMTRHLHALYQLPSEKWFMMATLKYLSDISKKCRKNPLSITGTDLIKYAVELVDSESQVDYLHGARLLAAYIKNEKGEYVRSLLLPSRQKIQKLMESLRIGSSLDEAYLEFRSRITPNRCLAVMSSLDDNIEIRELAATIVADLAGHIDLAQYPESMRYISSLLQEETTRTYRNIKGVPYPPRTIERLIEEEQWRQDFEEMRQRPIGPLTKRERRHDYEELRKRREMIGRMAKEEGRRLRLVRDQKRITIREERCPKNREGDASYELILQGLTILDRLASNKDNCSLICSAPGLLPKITAPLYSETLIQDVTNKAWSDIVTRSLKLLHKLIRAPESICMSLRQDISSNVQALSNLKGILNLSSEAGQELQLPTMEIVTELALDPSINLNREIKETLITKQCEDFLDNGDGGESAATAGRTLVSLSESNSDLIMNTRKDITGRLTELLDAKNSIIRRTIAAEFMENLCAHSDVDIKYMKGALLPKVLKEIVLFKREPQQRKMSPGQNNSTSGDEENQQRDSKSGKGTLLPKVQQQIIIEEKNPGDYEFGRDIAWLGTFLFRGLLLPQKNSSTSHQNKLSNQERENQEAFLSLTLAICNKLNSADDFDDAIVKTAGREKFVDTLKSIIKDNREATPDSLRIVKLCGRIAESMMECQQYQEYAGYFRNKGFESLLSQASETMSKLESCMLFLGTDFGLKKTVRPLISDIHLELESKVEHAVQEDAAEITVA